MLTGSQYQPRANRMQAPCTADFNNFVRFSELKSALPRKMPIFALHIYIFVHDILRQRNFALFRRCKIGHFTT